MRCPICQQPNQLAAPFCVECGETLALNNAADEVVPVVSAIAVPLLASPDQHTVLRLPMAMARGSIAVRCGLAALIIALVINWFAQSNAQADSNTYRIARDAEQQQQWHRAAALLSPLAAQNYAQASAYYRTAVQHVVAWDSAYRLAVSAEAAGATAQAAAYYRQASLLEPGYSDVTAKLVQLRKSSGQVIYRKSDGLYVATADGETELTMPGMGTNFDLLAVSADSSLICYTYDSDFGVQSTRNLVIGDIGRRYYAEQSFLFSGAVAQRPLDAAFLDNGNGLLFVVGGQFGANVVLPGDKGGINPAPTIAAPLELYYFDFTGDEGLREIGLASQVAHPNPADSDVYYVPADDPTAILAYDIHSGLPQTLARGSGRVAGLAVGAPLPNYGPYLYSALVEGGHVRIYSTLLLTTSSTLLLDEPVAADANTVSVKIATSAGNGQAIAILAGTTQAWQLQPTSASRLSDALLAPLGPLADVQYSPDGSRVLLTGGVDGTLELSNYLVLDRNGQPLRSGSYFNALTAQIGWLADSRHVYIYSHISATGTRPMYFSCRRGDWLCTQATMSVVDTNSSAASSLPIDSQVVSNPAALLATLPDGKSVIYTAADGLYVSALDDQPPAKVIDGATAVWSLAPLWA